MTKLKETIQLEKWKLYLGIVMLVFSFLAFMFNTIYSAVSLEKRMFDTEQQKQIAISQCEWVTEHKKEVEHLRGEYVRKEDYKEDLKDIKESLKEINKYLRDRR